MQILLGKFTQSYQLDRNCLFFIYLLNLFAPLNLSLEKLWKDQMRENL